MMLARAFRLKRLALAHLLTKHDIPPLTFVRAGTSASLSSRSIDSPVSDELRSPFPRPFVALSNSCTSSEYNERVQSRNQVAKGVPTEFLRQFPPFPDSFRLLQAISRHHAKVAKDRMKAFDLLQGLI